MNTSRRPDLDDLLNAWADGQRLPDEQAEQIRTAIVGQPVARPASPPASQPASPPTMQPATLPAAWWLDFSEQITSTLVQAGEQANRSARAFAIPTAA